MKIFTKADKAEGGFTLIELLVVIAIIGILSSIVTVSLNAARQKARDSKRLSDIHQMQTALQMYYNVNGATYPAALEGALDPLYISSIPLDPADGATPYQYCASLDGKMYHLGTKASGLEQPGSLANNDADAGTGTNPDGCDADTFDGTDPVYDVTQ